MCVIVNSIPKWLPSVLYYLCWYFLDFCVEESDVQSDIAKNKIIILWLRPDWLLVRILSTMILHLLLEFYPIGIGVICITKFLFVVGHYSWCYIGLLVEESNDRMNRMNQQVKRVAIWCKKGCWIFFRKVEWQNSAPSVVSVQTWIMTSVMNSFTKKENDLLNSL